MNNVKEIIQKINVKGTPYIYGVNWKQLTNNFDEKIVSKLAWEVDVFYLKEFQDALIKAWQENKPCWGNDEKFMVVSIGTSRHDFRQYITI